MKPITLLAAGALALAGNDLLAYQILESHFHVEVAPDKYVDQLVLRCEDGRQITVPWQSKLAEACGEDLMGNVTTPPKATAAPIDEQQKQAMMEQLRSQYGNISEKQVEFFSGPTGISTRFKPPIVEILKKYESCRRAQKDKALCAGERDKALARLADPKPVPAATRAPEAETAARETVAAAAPAETTGRSPSAEAATPARVEATPQAAKPETAPQTAAQTPRAQPAPPQAAETPPQTPAQTAKTPPATQAADTPPPAPPSEVEARTAAEQKILQEYMGCMRSKPKFDCDQARAKAMSALDKPKAAQKKQPRKPATSAVGPQAQR